MVRDQDWIANVETQPRLLQVDGLQMIIERPEIAQTAGVKTTLGHPSVARPNLNATLLQSARASGREGCASTTNSSVWMGDST